MKKTENNQFLHSLNLLYNDLCAQIQSKSKIAEVSTLFRLVDYISFHRKEVFTLSRTDLCKITIFV